MPRASKVPAEETGFFEPYSYYARTLRTWFVAYGIGGPAVIATHPQTLAAVSKTGQCGVIGWLFLAGVSCQVLIAFLNKVSMWYVYFGETQCDFRQSRRYRVAEWFSEQFWPDVLMDAVSLLCFAISTVMLFKAISETVMVVQ